MLYMRAYTRAYRPRRADGESMAEKFYITTAITYTSGKPHIGNTYEIILTDALARFARMQAKTCSL